MISATVTGNLGANATVKATPNGQTVTEFSIASRRFESGKESTDWVRVTLWGERGAKLAQHLSKGSRVAVRGGLGVREYEHQGVKKYSIELKADDVELMGSPQTREALFGKALDLSRDPNAEIPF